MVSNLQTRKKLLMVFGAAVSFTLAVFSSAVLFINGEMKEEIHNQILNRDAESFFLFSQMNFMASDQIGQHDMIQRLVKNFGPLTSEHPLSNLQGIIAVQIFLLNGQVNSTIPESVIPADVTATDMQTLINNRPLSRFHEAIWLDSLFDDPRFLLNDAPVPLLEITVPVIDHQTGTPLRFIQYWIDGKSMSLELQELNETMVFRTVSILLVGFVIIITMLGWAFNRLWKIHGTLIDHSTKLKEANRELLLSSKTSAIGSISAYLFHGIKSPLTGLHDFVLGQEEQAKEENVENSDEWQHAIATTKKLNQMIHEIVHLIREEGDPEAYDLSLEEIIEMVKQKVTALSSRHKVQLVIAEIISTTFPSRIGNLLVLILDNLIRNSIEATKIGGQVEVDFERQEQQLTIHINDQGCGIPSHIQANIFKPCISSKPNGNGIGLAITQQLCKHIGADLALKETGETGTHFTIKLPFG